MLRIKFEKTEISPPNSFPPPPRHYSVYDSRSDSTVRRSFLSSRDLVAPFLALSSWPKPKLHPRNPRTETRCLRPARRTRSDDSRSASPLLASLAENPAHRPRY